MAEPLSSTLDSLLESTLNQLRNMKTCFKCRESKEVSEFATKLKAPDGLQAQCRACQRQYRRDHYEANRQKYIEKSAAWSAVNIPRNRQFLIEYLNSHPCVDCGETDQEVLEFDHCDSTTKEFLISKGMRARRWESLIAEVTKCDVRCANCHRRRTNRQFGYWRTASPSGSIPE